jgi:LacI family transcriptional regulator
MPAKRSNLDQRDGRRSSPAPPARLVTLRQVADAARVHKSTASRALDPVQSWRISPETVARVHAAAERLGYTPHLVAAGLSRRQTSTVGVVVSDFDNPYSGRVIRGIASVLEERGFVALVAETVENPGRLERVMKHLLSRRVDAIITTAMHLDEADVLDAAHHSGLPVVLAGRGLPGHGFPAVVADDFNGGGLAAAHLLELGHEVLAQLLGPAKIDTFDRRRRGFQSRVGEERARDVTIPVHAQAPTVAEGRRLMELTLQEGGRPTAVFAHNDLMAVGAIEALETAGLSCPEDISIIGFNDIPLTSHLSPPLTTIRVATEELGRSAGWIALQLIERPSSRPEDVCLPAMLITRESTRRIDREGARRSRHQARRGARHRGSRLNW